MEIKWVDKYCLNCKKRLIPKTSDDKYRIKKGFKKFCSVECYYTYPKSEGFKEKLRVYHKGKPKAFNKKENRKYPDSRITFKCKFCGKEVIKYLSQTKGYKNTYCSNKCKIIDMIEGISGDKNYRWKSGWCRYYGSEWVRTRNLIYKRDNYTCQCCGEKYPAGAKKLLAHHRISRKRGGLDIPANLITLCNSCHATIENVYYSKAKPNETMVLSNGWNADLEARRVDINE